MITRHLEIGNMAEKKIEKGSEEWQFFQDFFKLRQKYYIPDNEDDWISELIDTGESIIDKYKNTDFAEFAQGIILEHFADIDRRCRRRNER